MFAFKQLEEKFLKIPEDVREAISSTETNAKLLALADKYELQYDEAEELTKEIGYVMLGLKPKKDFVKNVKKATLLDNEKSKQIVEEVNNIIFADIRNSLKKIYNDEEDENLNEEAVREELLNEIALPKEAIDDLIILPTEEKPVLKNQNIHTQKQEETQSTDLEKQKNIKNYTIDPYREPID